MAKKRVISEELKRFQLLSEYDFYIGEEEEETYEPDGSEIITEEPPKDGEEEPVDNGEAPAEGGEDPFGGEEMPPEGGEDPFGGEEAPVDGEENPFGGEEMTPENGDDPFGGEEMAPEPEPMEDEVEIDVTELVNNTEAAKASSEDANKQIADLLHKFDSLSAHLDKMSAISSKIDNLENEMEKRNPTPEEQLEMRSLSSYPYNLKLTDFWAEKEGNYDVMKGQKDMQNKEYVLTQDDVDRDYNDVSIKDSFSEPKDDDDDSYEFKNRDITY